MMQDTAEHDQASDGKPELTSRETPLLDVLMEVLHLFIGEEGVQGLLEAWGISPLVCVLDTNILLRDLVRAANMQERTGLVRAAQTGLVRLYASTTVRDEVPEKILLKQREMHFDDPDVALATWNEMYTPLVTFLDPLGLRTSSKATKALQLRDRDDVPTARIVELIHPDVIFSEDQDLQTFVTVAKEIWTQVAVALRDHAESGMVDVAISVGGGIVIQVSIASVSLFLRWLCSINRKVFLALAVIFGVALIIPQSRWFLLRQGQALRLLLNEQMWESVKATSDFLLKNYQRRKASGKFLALHGRTAHPRTALEYLGMVLARTPVPLRVRRIVEQMEALSYVPRGAHPETYVRQLLNAHPLLFEKTSARHWRLVSHGRADEQGLV